MGDATHYHHRVKIDLPTNIDQVHGWRERLDEMHTWCYSNYGDEWGYDKYGYWFKTQAHANWFILRWLNGRYNK